MTKRKINADDLRVGMYVVELDRRWTDAPFLFQGFVISSDRETDTTARDVRARFY